LSPAVGPDTALVKVFVISDFQCPVCKRAADGVAELFAVFGDEVQFIFWHNPLDMHTKALPMALASMAAGEQGKFWEYHDRMFENARLNTTQDLEAHATALGLDLERFRRDMESPAVLAKVRSDQGAAELLQARGTPALVVNGRLQVGWGSTGGLEHMIRQELTFMEALVKGGASVEEALLERGRTNAKSPELAELFQRHFLKGELAARP
jgi:protein-disulfide isomerase